MSNTWSKSKQRSGSEAIKALERACRFTFKKMKYTVIKSLSAEADRFISGATFAQQLCIYLPCTHAGCANSGAYWGESDGIMTAKIIVYWFGAWSESGGWETLSAWRRLCKLVISAVLCADAPTCQLGCYPNYTSSGLRLEPSGLSRGAD